MAQKILNGVHISGTTQLDFMPTHESEGIIKLGRYDSNTSRYHNIKSYVSSTEASNYLKFSLHAGTENAVVDVLQLKGDKKAIFSGSVEPSGNGSKDLGGSSNRWATVYASNISTTTSSTFAHDIVLDDHVDASPNLYFYNQANNYARLQFTTGDDLVLKIGTEPILLIDASTAVFQKEVNIGDVVDGPFTALRLMNQKTYGSGTGVNEQVRFVMGISESGYAFNSREGFAIDLGIAAESDSSNGIVNFKIRDGGVLGNYSTVTGSDKSVSFVGDLTANNLSGTNTGDQDLTGYLPLSAGSGKKLTGILYIQGTNSTNAESVLLRGVSSNDGDFLGSIRTANTGSYNQEMRFYTSNANGTTDEDLSLTLKPDGTAEFEGTLVANGVTLTGDQTLPTASSLGAVTLAGTQTITGAKTLSSTANHYSGHFYLDAYDAAGNHYPHFNDGSGASGTTVNWRQYYGTSFKTHTWASDSSGNMTFTFQGDIDANGGDISADNFSGSHSGATSGGNTGDNSANTHANLFSDRGAIDITTTTDGNNGLPFDNAHVETKISENGMRTINYTGASAFLYTFANGGSAGVVQLGSHYSGNDFYMRTRIDGSNWQDWRKLYHTNNSSALLNSNVTLATLGAQAAGNYVTISDTQTISGIKTFSNTVNVNPGSSYVSTIKLRRDTTADSTIVGDIEFDTTGATSTDDRIALIRAHTSGGDSTTRGGQMNLYTRKSNSGSFNTTTYNKDGNWTFPGEVEASSLDINGVGNISGNLDLEASFKWAKNVANGYTYSAADSLGMYIERVSTAGAGSANANIRLQARDNNSGSYTSLSIKGSDGTINLNAANTYVSGNLTVNGTQTILNTTTVEVEDNILQLNTTQGSPDTATAATSGISVYRGVDDSNNAIAQASLIFDDADDTWDLTNNLKVASNVDSQTYTIDGSTPQAYHDFQSKPIDTNSGLFTVGGHGMQNGYSRSVSMWSSTNGVWNSWVGTNLRWDGTNFKRASNNSGQNWGNIAGIRFLGNSQTSGAAIKFIIDPPVQSNAPSGEQTIGTSLPASMTAVTINNDLSTAFAGNVATDGIYIMSSAPDGNVFQLDQAGRSMDIGVYFASNSTGSEWQFKTSTGNVDGSTTNALVVKPLLGTFAGTVAWSGGGSANANTAYAHSQAAHAPSNAEQNVQPDWNATSGDAQILNKLTREFETHYWGDDRFVRTVTGAGVGGADTGDKWVHLSNVDITGGYEKVKIDFCINSRDDNSNGQEKITVLYENGSTAQENHQLRWYAGDMFPNTFKAVKSIRSASSGNSNTYDLYVQISAAWKDTFTVHAEYWKNNTSATSITYPTTVGSATTPTAGSDDKSLTSRQRWVDADTVDGISGASFLRSDTADTASGNLTFTGVTTMGSGTIGAPYDTSVKLHMKGATRSIIQQSSTTDAYYMFGDDPSASGGLNNAAWLGYIHSEGKIEIHAQTAVTIDKPTTISGTLAHDGLAPTTGTGIDQIKEVTMTFQLTANTWTDTNINGTDLDTGTYVIQVYIDDYSVGGGHYTERYSGTMSWYSANTNHGPSFDEIVLHRAGHSPNNGKIQLRTERTPSSDANDLMLQVKHTQGYSAALDNGTGKSMRFKFRRLI